MKTVIIGSGKVATWFGKIFQQHNHEIIQVYSREKKHASLLSNEIHSTPIDKLNAIDTSADVYLIAVADNAVQKIIEQLPLISGVIINTSGSMDINLLNNISANHGVMWPMISVTNNMEKKSDFVMITEASNNATAETINELASYFTDKIILLSFEKRQILHLSAVFANNFTNYLITISQEILEEKEIEKSILLPLLDNMVKQLENSTAKDLQTGPAFRNDTETMERHLHLLSNKPEYKKIYKLISDAIISFHKSD